MRHHLLVHSLIAALLAAGCGGPQPPVSTPSDLLQTSNSSTNGYKVLHNFRFRHDGRTPKAGLTYMDGMLYGTTYTGGLNDFYGTVFRISTSGKEKVVHSFGGVYTYDGANPAAGLLSAHGALYGTTEYGGIPSYGGCNAGIVFKLSASGNENILYRFYSYNCHDKVYNDGGNPVASLIMVRGTLYGTTYNGGTGNSGTVFSISPSGADYTILHDFGFNDGTNPKAALLYTKGTFYGTTYLGPVDWAYSGYGTVFTMSPSGVAGVLFAFDPYSKPEGQNPEAAVISVNGTLYGTTVSGGAYSGGTLFSLTTTGDAMPLHNFGSGSDGSRPSAPLLNVNGTLYGTTSAGGAYGEGTIFKTSLTGQETVLHSFGNGTDGATPLGGLIDVKGTLYGTTSAGGKQGYGTVFAIKP